MNAKINNKQLSYFSILYGIFTCVIYISEYLFISYFVSIGLRETASAFGLGLLLILGGIILIRHLSLGKKIILGYIFGNIIDRLLVLILYTEYVTFSTFTIPVIGVLATGYLLYHSNVSINKNSAYIYVIAAIILLIIIVPKVFF